MVLGADRRAARAGSARDRDGRKAAIDNDASGKKRRCVVYPMMMKPVYCTNKRTMCVSTFSCVFSMVVWMALDVNGAHPREI